MNRYLTEFFGTFFLVLTIGCTVIHDPSGLAPPLAVGAVLMALVYSGGHVSGAHYNPAVTLGMWIRGRLEAREILPYHLAQVLGAVGGALATRYLAGTGTPLVIGEPTQALVAESLFTFALMYVILNVATARTTQDNPFYGVAIGLTVMAGSFAVGTVSGAAFNPAVAIALSTMGLIAPTDLWIHIAGSLGGALAATVVFRVFNPLDS